MLVIHDPQVASIHVPVPMSLFPLTLTAASAVDGVSAHEGSSRACSSGAGDCFIAGVVHSILSGERGVAGGSAGGSARGSARGSAGGSAGYRLKPSATWPSSTDVAVSGNSKTRQKLDNGRTMEVEDIVFGLHVASLSFKSPKPVPEDLDSFSL